MAFDAIGARAILVGLRQSLNVLRPLLRCAVATEEWAMIDLSGRSARLAAAALVAGAAIGAAAIASTPVRAIGEPSVGHDHVRAGGPDQYAQVVAGGRQLVVVGPAGQGACQAGSAGLQIRATLSQVSTDTAGEGTFRLACPQADQPWRLTVDAGSGEPRSETGPPRHRSSTLNRPTRRGWVSSGWANSLSSISSPATTRWPPPSATP
jgi:hypothetical protein